MIEVTIIQLVCVAVCGINCGITIMLTKDTVKKWREARAALKAAETMLELGKMLHDIKPKDAEPLTSEENERV